MEQPGQQPNSNAAEPGATPALLPANDFAPYNPYAASSNAPAYSGSGGVPANGASSSVPGAISGNGGAPAFSGNGGTAPAAGAYVYPMSARPPFSYGAAASDFRPLNISEMLDRTFALYRTNFAAFLSILGVAYIPYLIMDVIFKVWWLRTVTSDVTRFQGTSFSSYSQYNELIDSLAHFYTSLGLYILLLALINVLLQVASAALIYAAYERYHGREVTISEAYGYVAGRLGALAGWIVLVYLLFLVAGICLAFFVGVIVVPIMAPFFFVSLQVLIIERRGPTQALSRSRELVTKGYWGMSIGLWLLTILLVWLLDQGIGTVLTLLLGQLPALNATTLLALNLAFTGLLDFVLAPISIIAFTIFYLNLRIRLEAYDIEALATATR
jgi:hypothetical protein